MITSKLLFSAVCFSLFFSATTLRAQGLYAFTFVGYRYETNAAGAIQQKRITERNLLQEIGKRANADSAAMANWELAYHVNGHDLGDTIDVIDKTTGRVLDTYIGLYFGQSFNRVGLTNATKTVSKRIDYIYTKQDSHSMGAALVDRTVTRVGSSSRVYIKGTLNYCWAPDQFGHTRMYVGQFRTGRSIRY